MRREQMCSGSNARANVSLADVAYKRARCPSCGKVVKLRGPWIVAWSPENVRLAGHKPASK